MIIAGIDYSMTCPCICLHEGNVFSYENCIFFYLTDKKKFSGSFLSKLNGTLYSKCINQTQRFDEISSWAIDILRNCNTVYIEDYAMGAKGKVFHIAENTGILKHKMYKQNIYFECIPPMVLKKFATGKGNSDKEKMYSEYCKQTNTDYMKHFSVKSKKIINPISDIVDSFYLSYYGWSKLNAKA